MMMRKTYFFMAQVEHKYPLSLLRKKDPHIKCLDHGRAYSIELEERTMKHLRIEQDLEWRRI